MDLTLVNIASKTTYDGKRVNILSTVGIYSLVACLEDAGISVDFREYFLDFEKTPSQEMRDAIKFFKNSERIIGIGCHSIHLPFAVRLAQEIKKAYPDKFIILGGIGPSIVAQSLMEKIKEIDLVVVGEAEINFPLVIKSLFNKKTDLSEIGGLVIRKDNSILRTPCAKRIKNLDSLPLPAYKYLDVKRYTQPMVLSARGCPFGCPFCSLSAYWDRKISYRSPEMMLKEFQILEKMGVESVFFADPCFMLDKKRLFEFLRIVKYKVKMEFKTYGRLDLIDEEACKALSEADFNGVFYGLESGSDAVLQQIKHGFNVQKGLEVIKMSKRYFKLVEVSLMWGFPFETLDDFKQTLDMHNYLKNELKCAVQLQWFQPFANTSLFQKYKHTLCKAESLSAIYDRNKSRRQVRHTLKSAGKYDYTISLRSMIGHAHVYSLAKDLIDHNSYLFPDFYRYHTPSLKEKIRLVNKIVPS